MGIEIIEEKTIKNIIYRILLLDNKYTIYQKPVQPKDPKEKDFSAVASFDTLEEARNYIYVNEKPTKS